MEKIFQGELFDILEYTFLCRECRLGLPRSIEFFPAGRCKDKLSSVCRKCSNSFKKINSDYKKSEILFSKKCEECMKTKELTQFYMLSYTHDGKTKTCKKCIDDRSPEYQIRQKYFRNFSWSVYFIQDSRNYRVKIGLTDNPEKTLSELQRGSSERLTILAIYDLVEKDKAWNEVKSLRLFFHSNHKGNDWFEMTFSLEHYISLINSSKYKKENMIIFPLEKNKLYN